MGDIFDNFVPDDTPDEPDYGTFNTDIVNDDSTTTGNGDDAIKVKNTDLDADTGDDQDTEGNKNNTDDRNTAGDDSDTNDNDTDTSDGVKPYMKEGVPKWIAQLSNEFRNDEEMVEKLSKFKTQTEVVKALLDYEEKLENSITVPKEGASKEEIEEFLKAMGWPENPDEYEIGEYKTPDGDPVDKVFRQSMLEAMHEAGLTKRQAQYVYDRLAKTLINKYNIEKENLEEQAKETEEYFRLKWGDMYDKKMENIANVIHKFGGPELIDAIENSGLANDRRFVLFVSKLADAMSEDVIISGEPPTKEEPIITTLSYPSMKDLGGK